MKDKEHKMFHINFNNNGFSSICLPLNLSFIPRSFSRFSFPSSFLRPSFHTFFNSLLFPYLLPRYFLESLSGRAISRNCPVPVSQHFKRPSPPKEFDSVKYPPTIHQQTAYYKLL